MSETDNNGYNLAIISDEMSHAEAFMAELRIATDSEGMVLSIEDQPVAVSIFTSDDSETDGWVDDIAPANVVVFVLRHIDVISLDRAKKIYMSLPSGNVVPFSVLILRHEGEVDYKMSCPYCAQKLWVRDSDVDKRGRCPNCKKAFTLPSQVSQLRAALKLPDAATVHTVYQENPSSCLGAVQNLLGSVMGELQFEDFVDTDAARANTMRVQVHEDE